MRPGRALAFLAGYNVAQNTLLSKRGYVAGNVIVTGMGLGWAHQSGLSWQMLGMSRTKVRAGLKAGVAVACAASIFAALGRDVESAQAMLDDERLHDVPNRELRYRLLVRYPIGTALFEEVWFRGLLPAALRQHGFRHPELVSSSAFAVWHVIPTAAAITNNPRGQALGRSQKSMLVAAGCIATGIAGLGFSALKRTSSSLVAPWLAHASFNVLGSLMGTRRLGRASRSEP